MIGRSLTQRYQWYCGVWLRGVNDTAQCDSHMPMILQVWLIGVNDTAESDSEVSMIPRTLTLSCQWYRRLWLWAVNDTTDSDSELSKIPWTLTLSCQWYNGLWLWAVNVTADSDLELSMIPRTLSCQWYRGLWAGNDVPWWLTQRFHLNNKLNKAKLLPAYLFDMPFLLILNRFAKNQLKMCSETDQESAYGADTYGADTYGADTYGADTFA